MAMRVVKEALADGAFRCSRIYILFMDEVYIYDPIMSSMCPYMRTLPVPYPCLILISFRVVSSCSTNSFARQFIVWRTDERAGREHLKATTTTHSNVPSDTWMRAEGGAQGYIQAGWDKTEPLCLLCSVVITTDTFSQKDVGSLCCLESKCFGY